MTNCSNCSIEIAGPSWRVKTQKYCSRKCQADMRWSLQKKRILCGELKEVRALKKYLIELDRRCSVCKGTEWRSQPIPLIFDHINGNSEDWSLTNIRLVCGNCDMQLPTYKKKNVGKGRFSRRQRYAEGKSY